MNRPVRTPQTLACPNSETSGPGRHTFTEQEDAKKEIHIESEPQTPRALQAKLKRSSKLIIIDDLKIKTEENENGSSLLYQIAVMPLSPEKLHFTNSSQIGGKRIGGKMRFLRDLEMGQGANRNRFAKSRNEGTKEKREYSLECKKLANLRVAGKLMMSQGRYAPKKAKQQAKLAKHRIKKRKRGFVCKRAVDSTTLRRDLLRKRRRDVSRDKTPLGYSKCTDCNGFVRLENRRRNKKSKFESKKKPRVKLSNFESRQCWKCRKINLKRVQQISQNNAKQIISNAEKSNKKIDDLFFRGLIKRVLPSRSISQEKSATSTCSNSSGFSDLSDISLQNKKIKKENARAQKRPLKVKNCGTSKKDTFISNSARGGEYMQLYRTEKDKLIVPERIKNRLHDVKDDEDFDTDEEQLKCAVNRVYQQFIKALHESKREESRKRKRNTRNSMA